MILLVGFPAYMDNSWGCVDTGCVLGFSVVFWVLGFEDWGVNFMGSSVGVC
jgi:hypothetical protein